LGMKKFVAAVAIFGVLTALPAYAVSDQVNKDVVHREWKGRDEEKPEKKEPKEKRPEKEELEKEAPEKREPEKDAPKKDKGKQYRKKVYEEFVKDPITVLENRKNEINKLLKEGKISREKADAMLKRIDAGITEIKKFNKLTLEEKRARLIKDCREYLDNLVERGEMDREKASKIYEDYAEKINKWDGTGYPKFFRKAAGRGKD